MCEVVVHRSTCFLSMNPQFHGYQDLALFIWKGNDFFLSLHLRAWQQQITVNAQVEVTWCFVTIFVFYNYLHICTVTYVHFSTTMLLDIDWIKSPWLTFLPNLNCTSIKRPTSIRGQFSKSWGWPLNRGPTVYLSLTCPSYWVAQVQTSLRK